MNLVSSCETIFGKDYGIPQTIKQCCHAQIVSKMSNVPNNSFVSIDKTTHEIEIVHRSKMNDVLSQEYFENTAHDLNIKWLIYSFLTSRWCRNKIVWSNEPVYKNLLLDTLSRLLFRDIVHASFHVAARISGDLQFSPRGINIVLNLTTYNLYTMLPNEIYSGTDSDLFPISPNQESLIKKIVELQDMIKSL